MEADNRYKYAKNISVKRLTGTGHSHISAAAVAAAALLVLKLHQRTSASLVFRGLPRTAYLLQAPTIMR